MTVHYKGQEMVSIPEYSFRQDDGLHLNYRERGIPSTILGRAQGWKNDGWDTYVSRNGAYMDLSISRTKTWGVAGINYVELWSVSTEMVEKSLFTLPDAIGEASSFGDGAAAYRKGIEDAVSERRAIDVAQYLGYTTAEIIWEEMMRGVQAYEHEYTVLTRTVNFEFESPPGDLELKPTRYIYTTDQLEFIEKPPADVMFHLPADPATNPLQSLWGWRIRDQSGEITNATTGSHKTSWVYAAWSTFLYTPYV